MRHRGVKPVITTTKHYVHHTEFNIAAGGISVQPAVHAVTVNNITAAHDVREGSVIKAVYIERWLVGDDAAGINAQFNLTVEKKSGSQPDMTFANSANLGAYPNKKNILYTTQGIVGSSDGFSPIPVIRQYILIPKGKQRFGLDDELHVNISFVTKGTTCGLETFKEYY